MLYGMYVSAAGALANSYRQDVVANNLANADTVAFKRDLALLRARPTESARTGSDQFTTALLEAMGGGTFAQPTFTDFTPANLTETTRPFDLALAGEGFFQVQRGSETCYTRDGRFACDQQNQLVSYADKLPVLDDAGQPIVLNPDLDFTVASSGVISQAGQSVARLGIVDFEDTSQLRKQQGNLYKLEGSASPQPIDAVVRQNSLEDSGVDALGQLVEMINHQRLFQTNLNMLKIQDETLGLATTRVASIT